MFTFSEIQSEVKRGAIRDQSGTVFDDGIKNVINRALFRLNREAPWRPMRRKSYFETVTTYTTGSGAVSATNDSRNITVTGATFLTDGVQIGRRIKISGSGRYYQIREITGETTLVLDREYDGTTTTSGTYSILAQEEYNMTLQGGHRMFMWHEEYGYPYQMIYITDQDFYVSGLHVTTEAIPLYYRMWGQDMVIEQVRTPSTISVVSSDATDVSIPITVFGIVSGYPDYEIISTNGANGTTTATGSKTFDSVERVSKAQSTDGRITVTANSGDTTISVIPVGEQTWGTIYRKIQLYPLPNTVFPMNVQYYKDPYKLVNDGDVHELGGEFDQSLIYMAIAILKYENNQSEGDKFTGLYVDEVKKLRRSMMDKIDWFPTLKRPKDSRQTSTVLKVHPYLGYQQVGSQYGPRRIP